MTDRVLPDISRLGYDSKKHAYTLDGTKLLSGVTTVLSATSDKAALINWSANMAVEHVEKNSTQSDRGIWLVEPSVLEAAKTAHTKKKEAAGEHGTDVHALVEEYIKECLLHNEGKPLYACVAPIIPFREWAEGEVDHFIVAEQKLYDEENAAAGTADFFYVSKQGELVVGDLKTFPKLFSVDAYVQCAMYGRMWRLLTGHAPTKAMVVKMCDPTDERLIKYGTKAFAVYERRALEEDEQIFLKRLDIYRHGKNFKSPKD